MYILSQFFFLDLQHADLAPRQIPVRWHPCSLLTEKQEYARTSYTVHVHGFFAPKLDWNLTNLGKMCWIPGKPTGRMAWRCFCHYFCMLPHLQIGFGNDLDRGLCAWRRLSEPCQIFLLAKCMQGCKRWSQHIHEQDQTITSAALFLNLVRSKDFQK